MTTKMYQTTGRGSVRSGVLVPNLDAALALLDIVLVRDRASAELKNEVRAILQQLRNLAVYEDTA